MLSLLLVLYLSAFASSASVRGITDVTEQQGCDVTVGVTYPETAEEEPSVTCSSQCFSDDEQTWFMGSTYKHLAGLTELGLMVEVKYDKVAVIDCRLVPIQSTTSLLEAFQACDNTIAATTASSAPTGTNTGTFIPTGTNFGTSVPTETFLPTGTNTGTFVPTETFIPTGTNTGTFVPTETNIPTATNIGTFLPTATNLPTGTSTATSVPSEATTSKAASTAEDAIACEHKETSPSTPAPPATTTALPPTTTTTPPPTTTAHVCPEGWLLNAGSCYHLSSSAGAWEEGRAYCSDNGGAYVKISSEEEWEFVKSLLSATTWIGLHDHATEGSFLWDADDSAPVYTKWHSNEPNDANGGEDCGEMDESKDFQWNDQTCSDVRQFVCEMNPTILYG